MRSRKAANEHVAEVARRRLELLSAELAAVREQPAVGSAPDGVAERGSGLDPPAGTGPRADEPGRDRAGTAAPAQAPRKSAGAPRPGRHARRSVGPVRMLGGWVQDRLPPTVQGRLELTSSHLTVVALLVAAALAVTAWWVVKARPGDATLVPASARQGAPTPSGLVEVPTPGGAPVSAPSAELAADRADPDPGSPAAMVVVDVAGKVRDPGIATLPVGSRVVDAVEAAGGPRKGVDLTALNLARVLVDGEQILVGLPAPAGVAASAASDPTTGTAPGGPVRLVNINTASQSQLEELPGIGPVTAEAILAWRTDHGAFTAVDELLEVSGIGEATLAEIAPFVTL